MESFFPRLCWAGGVRALQNGAGRLGCPERGFWFLSRQGGPEPECLPDFRVGLWGFHLRLRLRGRVGQLARAAWGNAEPWLGCERWRARAEARSPLPETGSGDRARLRPRAGSFGGPGRDRLRSSEGTLPIRRQCLCRQAGKRQSLERFGQHNTPTETRWDRRLDPRRPRES